MEVETEARLRGSRAGGISRMGGIRRLVRVTGEDKDEDEHGSYRHPVDIHASAIELRCGNLM